MSRHDARFVASFFTHHISSTISISCSIIFHHHMFHSSPISTISSIIVPIFSHSSSFFIFPFHVSIIFPFIFSSIFIFISSIIIYHLHHLHYHSFIATNLASCPLIHFIIIIIHQNYHRKKQSTTPFQPKTIGRVKGCSDVDAQPLSAVAPVL